MTSGQNRVKFGNFTGLYLLKVGIGLQLTAKFCTKGNSALENFQSTTLDFRWLTMRIFPLELSGEHYGIGMTQG